MNTYTITFSAAGCQDHTERTNLREAKRLAHYLVGNGYDYADVSVTDPKHAGGSIRLAAWRLTESGRVVEVNP